MYIGSREDEHQENAEDLQEHLEGLLYVRLHGKVSGFAVICSLFASRRITWTLPYGLMCTATRGHVLCTRGSVSMGPLSMWSLGWEAETWPKEPCRELIGL